MTELDWDFLSYGKHMPSLHSAWTEKESHAD